MSQARPSVTKTEGLLLAFHSLHWIHANFAEFSRRGRLAGPHESLLVVSDGLAKEYFTNPGSAKLLDLLEQAGHKGMTARGSAFGDFLELAICALSGGQMEEAYLAVARRYSEGEKGKRGIDRMAEGFGLLVNLMEETRGDILGDVFQGGITWGEHGQFYTPDTVCDLMAQMSTEKDTEVKTVNDPCCGSGRMLLAVAKVNPHWQFHGQDVDIRCVRMCAINLAFRGLHGLVIHGDTLRNERWLAYQTGFNGKGFVREVPIEELPAPSAPSVRVPSRLEPDAEERKEETPIVQGSLFA